MTKNLTEEIIRKIEENDAKNAETPAMRNKRILKTVMENPWSVKYRNITNQCMVAAEMPELAAVLKSSPEYSVSDMYPFLPEYAQKAIKGTLDSLKTENDRSE